MPCVTLLAFAAIGLCSSTHVSMESDAMQIPANWAVAGPTPRYQMIELSFAVKQRGLENLHHTLMAVSTPSSPKYGQHLANDDVQAMTAPEPSDIQAVHAFLAQHKVEVSSTTSNSDMIFATVPVEVAERMLSASYVQAAHGPSGLEVSRALSGYKLPAAVAAVVDFVSPTVHLPGAPRRAKVPSQESNAILGGTLAVDDFSSPKNLRRLYSIGDAEGKAANNKMAITAFDNQGFGSAALHRFWNTYCTGIHCGKGEPKMVGDVTKKFFAGTESMLDIETITSVAGNISSEYWGFGGMSPDNPQNEPFMKWLAQVSNTSDADVPKLFSTSYGQDESDWSLSAAQRMNVEFQKAGARGISILFASGDSGANCKGGRFVPQVSSSPFVTSVGGTRANDSWEPGCETTNGISSGGFSNRWPMPDYQKSAVAAYLRSNTTFPNQSTRAYNTSGRAYPDVSAQSDNFIVYTGWLPTTGVSGTSASAPLVSGIFALLNDLRLQNGKPTLGFLNPLIYENMAAFNDITTGSTMGCFIDRATGWDLGWPAAAGWDAATGVGSPNYAKLAKVVATLGDTSSIVV